MHEVIVQLLRLARGTWRYRWWMLGVAWVICLVGWTSVARQPDVYRASARVFVDTSSVLRPYLKGLAINTNDTGRKLSLMTRTLLSRPNLEKVMRMTDLDLKAQTEAQAEGIINRIRGRLRFRGTGRANLYTITYVDQSPELAKLMVKSLLTIFMEGNLGEVRKDQDSASQFLEQQLAEYERRMREIEEELAKDKHKNYSVLPGDASGYYSDLRKTQSAIAEARLNLQIAEDRMNSVSRQIEGEEPAFGIGPNVAPRSRVQFKTPNLDKRIGALQVRLDNLLVRYTERHPDVITSRRKLADLEAARAEAIEKLRRNYVPEQTIQQEIENNPVHQQMRLSMIDLESDVAAKRRILQAREARLQELESSMGKILQISARQKQLKQDYDIARRNHGSLLTRLESARLGRRADNSSDSVRFRVIDPPRAPVRPSGPNRIYLSSLVLGGGLAFGFALAFLMSQLRPTYDDRQILNDALGLPVLGSVNMVWTSDQVRARKMRNVSFVFTLAGLLLTFGVVLALYKFNIDLLPRLAQSMNLA